jgi:amidohydrolase
VIVVSQRLSDLHAEGADTQLEVAPPAAACSDDFSFLAQKVPGLLVLIGSTPVGEDANRADPNLSPRFRMDEAALLAGSRTLAYLTMDNMAGGAPR